jgi:short-subunit dehydrogenase
MEEIEWQLGINLWGVIYGTKAFLPILLQQKEGHIVNLSSVFGLVAVPGQSAYNVSKFGVRGWTECLWQELAGSGVQATCVHPGGIRTGIAQTGRMGANADHIERRLLALADKLLVTPPEDMAAAILVGVTRGKKRIIYGSKACTLTLLQRLLPVSYGKVLQLMERFS